MKTIAICNHKGGVGKTALSMAIAEGLHRKGKRTLLVDLDQQMNATQQAKIDTTDEVTVYDLLTSFDYTAKDGIKHFDGGDIIPGDVLVSNAESDMAKLDTRLTMLGFPVSYRLGRFPAPRPAACLRTRYSPMSVLTTVERIFIDVMGKPSLHPRYGKTARAVASCTTASMGLRACSIGL